MKIASYTINQAVKKIPIANSKMVNCGYKAGFIGLTYLLMLSIDAWDFKE